MTPRPSVSVVRGETGVFRADEFGRCGPPRRHQPLPGRVRRDALKPHGAQVAVQGGAADPQHFRDLRQRVPAVTIRAACLVLAAVITVGRPPTRPRRRAAATPAIVRSRIRSRSIMWTAPLIQVRPRDASRLTRTRQAAGDRSPSAAGCPRRPDLRSTQAPVSVDDRLSGIGCLHLLMMCGPGQDSTRVRVSQRAARAPAGCGRGAPVLLIGQ